MSSAKYLSKTNDVNKTQVQEDRSARQQQVREATNDIKEETIAMKFVGTNMDQYGIIRSTRNRHSPTTYTLDLSNKNYKTGTLHLNVSDSSTMVMYEEGNMINVLGWICSKHLVSKRASRSFSPRDKRQ